MSKYNTLPFQQKALEDLNAQFKRLWKNPNNQLPLLFESPTGSGKTFMICNFINGLARQPDWDDDVAFGCNGKYTRRGAQNHLDY